MSGFVSTFCVFPTSFNACYTGLLPEILQAMLECPKLRFYPKSCVDLVDLSSRDQKRQKAKTDIFTGTPFSTYSDNGMNLNETFMRVKAMMEWLDKEQSRII